MSRERASKATTTTSTTLSLSLSTVFPPLVSAAPEKDTQPGLKPLNVRRQFTKNVVPIPATKKTARGGRIRAVRASKAVATNPIASGGQGTKKGMKKKMLAGGEGGARSGADFVFEK